MLVLSCKEKSRISSTLPLLIGSIVIDFIYLYDGGCERVRFKIIYRNGLVKSMHTSFRISALLDYLQPLETVSDLDLLLCGWRLLVLGLIQNFDYLLFFLNRFRWFSLDLSYLLFIFFLTYLLFNFIASIFHSFYTQYFQFDRLYVKFYLKY